MDEMIEIYPSYSVSPDEYERRFRGVELDYFRKVMSPELFKAFVRTAGVIEGCGIEPWRSYDGKD